ncbi:hypothetical protein EV363DRAFT_1400727 [Boletus edulis]|uniref:Uncharacterized protein n=1 Tax=Boletus edulis BED1 TaxID=1328754 RepID=A0AAD4BFN0_BOLED|nr:hypothetical protein EV363DRAFT_1400727 [Boletus edulis]KAF8425068.1 hypothetical protein L210DRAFT_3567567 [Boletus edulis BED1]
MKSAPSSRFARTPGRAFPAAQHRFKSAFARARDEVNLKGDVAGSRRTDVPFGVSNKPQPSVAPPGPLIDPKPIPTNTDALLQQIHDENMRMIARMSDDDIEHVSRNLRFWSSWERVQRSC